MEGTASSRAQKKLDAVGNLMRKIMRPVGLSVWCFVEGI
jgi:hypothetical protein